MDATTVEKIVKEIENIAPMHEGEHVGKVVSVGGRLLDGAAAGRRYTS